MALIISTWIWGDKYTSPYIARLERGVRFHMAQKYRWLVFTPIQGDEKLYHGCFCRLRMFSPSFQRAYGLKEGDRLVCLDLDLIVTGQLDTLFERPESFVILGGANAANPNPFNGSVMMLRIGEHADVWEDFSLEEAQQVPYYEFPDDQGWIWHKLPKAAVWKCGKDSGIYAFRKPGWPKDDQLPGDAKIVAFPGRRDPSQFQNLPWIQKYWR
jgi:hypothetical protein